MKLRPSFLLVLFFLLISSLHAQFANGPAAEGVLGQADFVSYSSGVTAGKFNGPMQAAVDTVTGKLFVSDRYNNRVLRFSSANAYINGSAAEAVLGQADFSTSTAAATPTASSMNNPIGIIVDKSGILWVADFNNSRVLRFDNASSKASGAAADGVLGQPDFVTKTAATTAAGLNNPVGISMDNDGILWVADFNNHRIIKYTNAAAKSNGAAADGVLGQSSFTTKSTGTTAATMNNPNGVYADVYGNVWVSDRVNYRFLRFNAAASKANGAAADGVLGQPDFVTAKSNITVNGSGYARHVWGDKNGRIYCMQENHRILVFDDAAGKPNGADANGVIGQTDFTANLSPQPPTASTLKDPKAIYVNNKTGDVWVSDATNHRMLRYNFNKAVTVPLTITAPDGGEEWGRKSVEEIKWTGNYSGKVKLEYSTNSGTSWTYIDTSKTVSGTNSYSWTVPNAPSVKCLLKVTDFANSTIADTSNKVFQISDKVIVVMGSSTAAGTGPAIIDSAWVWRYRRYVKSLYPTASVINIAVGGYTTYEEMPTGFVPPAGKAAPKTGANITKALSYSPDAVILSLTTNDAYWNYTLNESLFNYSVIAGEAKKAGVPMWITSTSGRNLSQSGRDLLLALRDSLLSIYKPRAIDIWTGLSGNDGYLLSQYNSGDGVHMNSDGHAILFQRMVDARIFEQAVLGDTIPAVSILKMREDLNSDFVPDRKGQTMKVTGVVVSPDFTASAAGNNYYITDGTAGVLMYSAKKIGAPLAIGDSIMVRGKVDQFKGATEFVPADTVVGGTGSITLLKKNARVPAPIEITAKEVNSEKYEGSLVKVKGLSKKVSSPAWPAAG
ncbi:MAG: GDSL-type esterase/lipase family protein, partial [Syntrophothermus sp.]